MALLALFAPLEQGHLVWQYLSIFPTAPLVTLLSFLLLFLHSHHQASIIIIVGSLSQLASPLSATPLLYFWSAFLTPITCEQPHPSDAY
jgi:hypothetical protein